MRLGIESVPLSPRLPPKHHGYILIPQTSPMIPLILAQSINGVHLPFTITPVWGFSLDPTEKLSPPPPPPINPHPAGRINDVT